MITLRLTHDQKRIYEETIDYPATGLSLGIAFKMTMHRAKERKKFEAKYADLEVRMKIGHAYADILTPETRVPNTAVVEIETFSAERPRHKDVFVVD